MTFDTAGHGKGIKLGMDLLLYQVLRKYEK
jgi:hypothetical protein